MHAAIRRTTAAALVLGASVLAAGCSVESRANAAAENAALAVAQELGVELRHSSATRAAEYGRRAAESVDLLSLDEARDGETSSVRLVIRTEGRGEAAPRPQIVPGQTTQVATVVRCYELVFAGDDDEDGRALPVDCPADAEPISYPPLPPTPELPEEFADLLSDALAEAAEREAVSEEQVRAVVDGLSTGEESTRDLAASDGAVGLAFRAGDDCVLGRVAPGDSAVWTPARVQLQPGELNCSAGEALGMLGSRPPH
ncbi:MULTISPECIES: hypothetical protein [Actinoalloteichus]|uniref:PASTA domain-containing protein n=1 Tax=Actinoalloteichus fjordicus TaxID=1612552 RepID=A0AAC9PUG1_9PSEU|nr:MULTISPECIES: hypothetical protein [Actinoalloteichus]APU16941.1 hypothetical protein UA74_24635 [Actinoalloteichus fjordicus]APU23021.1 hypothetical protein UA75_25215 [Actinoalloteichus sp. GBA129-24]